MEWFNTEYAKYNSNHKSWKNGLFSALLVLLLFILFQPFGFRDKSVALKIYLYPLYSLLAFFHTTLNFYFVRKVLKSKRKWNVRDELISLAISIFFLTFFVHLLSYQITGDMPFNFSWYFRLFYHVLSLSLVIAAIEFLYYFNKSSNLKIEQLSVQNQLISKELEKEINVGKKEKVSVVLEKETIEINRNKIILIQSVGNYLEFYLLDEENRVKKLMKRGRLHQAEKDLDEFFEFFRCHRAFIVNLKYVSKIIGKTKNARLIFNKNIEEIPVSRARFKTLKGQLDRITRL